MSRAVRRPAEPTGSDCELPVSCLLLAARGSAQLLNLVLYYIISDYEGVFEPGVPEYGGLSIRGCLCENAMGGCLGTRN
eukprot:COSAG01_NODE_789_length_13572_cov_322.875158_10_plen_79_part_00